MTKIKCDRCGAEIPHDENGNCFEMHGWLPREKGLLCNRCAQKLTSWLKSEIILKSAKNIGECHQSSEGSECKPTNADYIRSLGTSRMAQSRIRKIYFYNGSTVWVGDFGETPNLGEAYKAEIDWLEQPWEDEHDPH